MVIFIKNLCVLQEAIAANYAEIPLGSAEHTLGTTGLEDRRKILKLSHEILSFGWNSN